MAKNRDKKKGKKKDEIGLDAAVQMDAGPEKNENNKNK